MTSESLDSNGRELLFNGARSIREFSDEPVPDALLSELWDLARMPPTAWNCQPLRVVHVRSESAKARLLPLVAEQNQPKVSNAPVTSILAADSHFHERLPELFPRAPQLRESLEGTDRPDRDKYARFNASLQIGYFVMAARAVGLSAGPMAGFDADAVTKEFLDAGRVDALLLVNLGYPGPNALAPRLPRLPTDSVVSSI